MERGPGFSSSLRDLPKFLSLAAIGSGVVAWFFAATKALVIMAAGGQAKLSPEVVALWIFIIYLTAGIASLFFTLYYRQPISVAWTIPGAILIGEALQHMNFNEAVGAYIMTGVLVLVLGMSGLVKWAIKWVPLPVMMGMVAGVLMPFGISIVTAFPAIPAAAIVTFGVFIGLTLLPKVSAKLPPTLAALVVGLVAVTALGEAKWAKLAWHLPPIHLFAPTFSANGFFELAIPLTLMVIGVQNVQAIGVLLAEGYRPPVTAFTTWSGVGSLVNSLLGGHPMCIAGPTTAILADPGSGPKEGRYASGVINAILWAVFALFSAVAVSLTKVVPMGLITLLGGLAMLGVLVSTFREAFSGKFRLGAMFAFLISVSNVTFFRVGAPFWALVGGVVISLLLERADFKQSASPSQGVALR